MPLQRAASRIVAIGRAPRAHWWIALQRVEQRYPALLDVVVIRIRQRILRTPDWKRLLHVGQKKRCGVSTPQPSGADQKLHIATLRADGEDTAVAAKLLSGALLIRRSQVRALIGERNPSISLRSTGALEAKHTRFEAIRCTTLVSGATPAR